MPFSWQCCGYREIISESKIWIHNKRRNIDELRTQSNFQTRKIKCWRKGAFIIWIIHAYSGKKRSFSLSSLSQAAEKNRSRDRWQTDAEYQILNRSFPFHRNQIFWKDLFNKSRYTERLGSPTSSSHLPPHSWLGSRSEKKGTVPKRLHGSVCCSGTPRSRQALRPECLIYHEYFHGVNSGRFHSFCPLRNPYCWKIAKLLYSGALGWLLCRTRNVSKGLVRKTVAMYWGRE